MSFLWAGLAAAQPTVQPIIDMHMHSHSADRFGRAGLPNPVTGAPSAATTDDALLSAARAAMDRYNIRRAVAFSARQPTQQWVASDRRFLGGTQIDVGIPMPELAQLRSDIRAGRVKAIGEIGAQYLGLAPTDAALRPYFDLAEEFELPVGIHTGIAEPGAPYQCCPRFRIALGRPALLEELLIKRPKLRIYLQHAGYPFLEETVAIMSVYPQVYADISVINWIMPEAEFYAYLQSLLRAGLGKRLMFGSDQMIWPEAIGMAIERVRRAPFLSEDQKADIFYNNAARFLRLSPQEIAADHKP
jgi:predicted TIM-barrel fold metal-dependent hydrolase